MPFLGCSAYTHLRGYLHRWRLLEMGRWMLRVHHILTPDGTPFLHSHPFDYVSLVLWGGYTERVLQPDGSLRQVRRWPGHLVWRPAHALHRIDRVGRHGCVTLFLAHRRPGPAQGWVLQRHPAVRAPDAYWDAQDGLYAMDGGWRKRQGGAWYALRATPREARDCTRLSLHQSLADRQPTTKRRIAL